MQKLKMIFLAGLLGGSLAACTATQIAQVKADVNAVIADIQTVCHAVVDNSTGAVAQYIDTFAVGTAAITIAVTACNFIDAVPPLSAHRLGVVPWQTVVVNNVVLHFVKTR